MLTDPIMGSIGIEPMKEPRPTPPWQDNAENERVRAFFYGRFRPFPEVTARFTTAFKAWPAALHRR
jgi:hypothetical protein